MSDMEIQIGLLIVAIATFLVAVVLGTSTFMFQLVDLILKINSK